MWSDPTVSISGSESAGDEGSVLVTYEASAQAQQGQVGNTTITMLVTPNFLWEGSVLAHELAFPRIDAGDCRGGIEVAEITVVPSIELSVLRTQAG